MTTSNSSNDNQTENQQVQNTVTLILNDKELNIILDALLRRPARNVYSLIKKIEIVSMTEKLKRQGKQNQLPHRAELIEPGNSANGETEKQAEQSKSEEATAR